jgi:hypothetical protein
MRITYNPTKATAGRGAAIEPVTRSQRSTESANTPANDAAPTDAEQATAGRGNFFSRYKTPLIIGGLALAAIFILSMNRSKSK